MSRDDIYKVPPADNMKVASMELKMEEIWLKAKEAGYGKMVIVKDVQALIERIKLDEKKIQQLEKMNGITWLGDEQREKGNRTAATLYKDRGNWPIPINCADGGFREQAYWQGREDGAREMEKEMEKQG